MLPNDRLPTKKGLQLSSAVPNYEVYIQGDQSALEQAIEKLLGFTINYCDQDSKIQVSLSAESVNGVAYAQLEISSLGLDVAVFDLTQIFLPFYKSSEGNIRNSGLQLSIAKEITELHKGEISAEADSEKGICFRMKLPATRIGEELVPTP